MNTPTSLSIPSLDLSQLSEKLQQESRRQMEATPEPVFRCQPDHEQAYQWLCEIHHEAFVDKEIEKVRSKIHDVHYWREDAWNLQRVCESMAWIPREGSLRRGELDAWRDLSLALRQLLQVFGFDDQVLTQLRHRITNPQYWEVEDDCFKRFLAKEEFKMQQKTKRQLEREERRPRQTQQRQKDVPPRRSDRLRAINASRVEKRVGHAAVKKAHQ